MTAKTINQWLKLRPDPGYCSRCGREVPEARGNACVCDSCTQQLAGHQKNRPDEAAAQTSGAKNPCPDCGAERRPGKRYCDPCVEKRRRASSKRAIRKHRAAVSS